MKIAIKVPQLPESVSEATLLAWHHQVGDQVSREENLIDIETDKVVLEIPSPQDGALVEVLGKEGDTVKSGQVIAYLESEASGKSSANTAQNTVNAPSMPPPSTPPAAPSVLQPTAATATASATLDSASSLAPSMSASIMPSANKLAHDSNLNIEAANIQGSGRDGRILKEDILKQLAKPNNDSKALEERVPMSRLRKRIAERLLSSQQTNAILTTFNEVNMQPVMDLRNKYKEAFEKTHGVKLGFMSFFVKAVVAALMQYPVVNASIDGDDIVYHGYFDIGVAIGSPRGLVVPILRNVAGMSFADIEKQINLYSIMAKDGKLNIDDLTGGTFSISNGGTFGSMMSTPIINPPQSAILGMHAIKDRVMVENGAMVIRPMMYVALSYDHRLIDGKEAVLALVAIKNALEDPSRLLLAV